MSRIGKKPIEIIKGAEVSVSGSSVTVKGSKGSLTIEHRPEVSVKVDEGQVIVERADDSRSAKAFHGLTRSLIANMIEGVVNGYKKELEVHGVGYTAKVQGKQINLKLGFADTRVVMIPDGITVTAQPQGSITAVTIEGFDKQLVGQVAGAIRQHRKPEPYNGKGVHYKGEKIIRKQGKAFGS